MVLDSIFPPKIYFLMCMPFRPLKRGHQIPRNWRLLIDVSRHVGAETRTQVFSKSNLSRPRL